MKSFFLTFFILSVLFFGNTLSVSVVDLNESTYDQAVKSNPFSFIMLYAPWCGYCGQFKPIFEEAASKTDKFYFGRVDCTIEPKLCQKLRINYYPTLTFFKYGHSSSFSGERTATGVLEFLEKYSHFNGPILKTKEEIEQFRSKNLYHVIGYYSNQESQAFKNFMIASEKRILHETPVALVNDTSLFDGRTEGTVDVFNSQYYNPIQLTENTELSHDTISELATNIFQRSFPLTIHINDDNYPRYRQSRKNLYLSWIDLKDSNKDANIKILEDVAKAFPQFNFGYVDYNEKKERLYKLGAVRQQVNTILRIDFSSEESYIYEAPQPFSVEGISKWISGIVSGDVKPTILSELIPEVNDGPVYKVVGLTFDQIVMDPTKDVFVQYYIDWCEGCKYMETMDKVGEALKGIDDVLVAKIDYNINDLQNIHLEIYGNPTIAIYLRNDKTHPVIYSGSQTSSDMLSFFKNHTLSEKAKAVPDLPNEAPPRHDIELKKDVKVIDVDGKTVKHDEL